MSVGRIHLLSGLLAAQIFLVVPATIYLDNIFEFAARPAGIFALLAVPALCLVLCSVFCTKLPLAGSGQRLARMLAILIVLIWVQANLLVWDYGHLDGRRIDWAASSWRGWADGAWWVCALLLSFRLRDRHDGTLQFIAVGLFAVQCLVVGTDAIGRLDELREKSRTREPALALRQMARFSPDTNTLHIILDSFQSDIFRELLDMPDPGARYRSALQGFVFYEENAGVFPYTQFALPAIMSGRIYRNEVPKKKFLHKVFRGATVLNAARDAGYEVDIASIPLLVNQLEIGAATHSYYLSESLHFGGRAPALRDAAELLDLALFRIAPHVLKRLVYNEQDWLLQEWILDSDYSKFPYFTHNAFLAGLRDAMTVDRATPVYKFFHVLSTHAPIVVNDDCSYAGHVLPRVRATVVAQSKCTMEFVLALLERMKELGIYDDALIILMADHGGHIPPSHYVAERLNAGGAAEIVTPWLVAMASPLLLVKEPSATGELRVSGAPTSLLDIPATVDSALKLNAGFEGRPVPEQADGDDRERVFFHYPWRRADYLSDYILPIQEYRIRGSVYRSGSWQRADIFAAPDPAGAGH